jgi:hypothetical protein
LVLDTHAAGVDVDITMINIGRAFWERAEKSAFSKLTLYQDNPGEGLSLLTLETDHLSQF